MYQDALLFLTGSWAYPAIEMLWRGETHSSMALAGGICLCLINHICCGVLEDNNIFSRCLAGAGIITGVELVLGLVLNCLLGFDIWDYSNVPLNLLGQVCLPNSDRDSLETRPDIAQQVVELAEKMKAAQK